MARIYGYARPTVSLPDTCTLGEQLAKAGAEHVFVEKHNGHARRGARERQLLLKHLEPDDGLILHSLDQLGTSLEDVLRCFEMLVARGVHIKILNTGFETADAPGSLAILKMLVETISALHSETTRINLAAARATGGRPAGKPASLRPEQWPDIQARIAKAPLDAVAEELGVSRQTLWTYRRRMARQDGTTPS